MSYLKRAYLKRGAYQKNAYISDILPTVQIIMLFYIYYLNYSFFTFFKEIVLFSFNYTKNGKCKNVNGYIFYKHVNVVSNMFKSQLITTFYLNINFVLP